MSSDRTPVPVGATPAAADPADVAGLKRQVERTRAELADTVEGLMYQLDVKARGREKVDEATAQAKAKAAEAAAQARARAAGAAAQAKLKGEELKDRALVLWREKPLVVVGIGAGVVVAVAVVSAVGKGSK